MTTNSRSHSCSRARFGLALAALVALGLSLTVDSQTSETVRAADTEKEPPKLLPGGMGGRSGANREKLLKDGGGNADSEAAVAGGLKWLVRHQFSDGHWGLHNFAEASKCSCGQPGAAGHEIAATSLALLPLLGAGETSQGKGNFTKNVDRGLKWLVSKQAQDGQLGEGYSHGLAALTLCEAYGLTADPALKGPAQRAINKVVDWQGPNGGFRYAPKQPGDTSVTGWHVQAIKAAQLAGLKVPQATLKGANDFLDKTQTEDGSGYGYTGPDANNYRLRAVGLLSREYLGWGPQTKGLMKGAEALQKEPPTLKDSYYFYYGTQVMHHLSAVQPEAWEKWNEKLRDDLIKAQDKGATADKRDQKGSWDPTDDAMGKQLGRLGYTSLCVLTLEVYYRHTPLYAAEKKEEK